MPGGRPTPLGALPGKWCAMTLRGLRQMAVIMAAAVVVVAAAGFAVRVLVDRTPGPASLLRTRQARAMLPVINAYLNSRQFQNLPDSGTQPGDGYLARSRWFCDAAILEIRPGRAGWRVGIDVMCIEYARRGNALVEGAGGDNGEYIVSVSARGGRYQVLSSTGGQLVVPDPPWVRQHFSPRVAAEVNSNSAPYAPLPTHLARQAFGLPPRAPVVSG